MTTGYFFDMDGTLYNNAFHTISHKTFQALYQLKDQKDMLFLTSDGITKVLSNTNIKRIMQPAVV